MVFRILAEADIALNDVELGAAVKTMTVRHAVEIMIKVRGPSRRVVEKHEIFVFCVIETPECLHTHARTHARTRTATGDRENNQQGHILS